MEGLLPLLFGLIGTAVMTLALYVVGQSGGSGAAGVRGVGSSISTAVGGSQLPGAVVHLLAGIAMAYAYWAIARAVGDLVPATLLLLGGALGVARGLVVSAVLGMLAFDQMPMERMSQAGPGVGTIHVIGNILCGLVVSALFGFTSAEFALRF